MTKPPRKQSSTGTKKSKKIAINKASTKLLIFNSKQNLTFYRYFFIITFGLLITSLLWNTYLYAYADALKNKVLNLSETVESLVNTVETFGLLPSNNTPVIGSSDSTVTPTKKTFIRQVDKQYNYKSAITIDEASDVVLSGNFPMVLPTIQLPTNVILQKLYITADDTDTPVNSKLFYGYYSYNIQHNGYKLTINSGIYPTGGTCDERNEFFTTNYGKLAICNQVTSLTFPDLTNRYNLPSDYRFEIIDSSMEMPKEFFTEIINSIRVFEPLTVSD